MKVLAERSNKIFLWGPVVMLLCVLVVCNISGIAGFLPSRRTIYVFCGAIFIGCVTCFDLLHRLLVPKIMIEYDDYGLYIYKHKGQPPATVRYSDLKGVLVLEGANDSYELDGVKSFRAFSTGMLRIQTSKGLISLYGIKNVRQVGNQLNKMLKDYNRRIIEEYDQRIEQTKRQRELEELQKHDPNT